MDRSIDLVFGMVVFSGLSYTVLEENLGTSKINALLSGILLANSGLRKFRHDKLIVVTSVGNLA